MAPPTIAPPIRPAATPAATPSPARAAGAPDTSEPAMVATATRAAIVFFIPAVSWSRRPLIDAGLRVTERAATRTWPFLQQSAETVNPEYTRQQCAEKKRRFLGLIPEHSTCSGMSISFVTKVNGCSLVGSAADPHAAEAPAIAVPEALALPVAAAVAGIGDIARTAVIAIARAIITRSVVVGARGDRAANDRAPDQPGGNTRTPA